MFFCFVCDSVFEDDDKDDDGTDGDDDDDADDDINEYLCYHMYVTFPPHLIFFSPLLLLSDDLLSCYLDFCLSVSGQVRSSCW